MSWQKVLYAVVIVIFAGVSALTGAVAGGVAVYSAMINGDSQTGVSISPTPVVSNEIQLSSTQFETAITQSAERTGPSVITVISRIPGQMTFFGKTGDSESSGSGIIITADGYAFHHMVIG